VQVEASWRIYQQIDRRLPPARRALGYRMVNKLIQALSAGVPAAPTELSTLGCTLKRRATDVLTYSPGPAPATARPKPEMAGSRTAAATPSASATSPTTSPDPCGRPVASDPDYTLDYEERVAHPGANSCALRARAEGTPTFRAGPLGRMAGGL